MNDYALVWNTNTSMYDIYAMSDSKTQNYKLGSIDPDNIYSLDINDRIAHERGKEHEC